MVWHEIIEKYYVKGSPLYNLLVKHSTSVAEKALSVVKRHPEMHIDEQFVLDAAMMHDIGIYQTDAPPIYCYGEYNYICHGYLGADMLRAEGLDKYARVCERHTGVGITKKQILAEKLPMPLNRIYLPQTIEEKVICYADKFFSKTRPDEERTVEEVEKKMARYGADALERFHALHYLFQ